MKKALNKLAPGDIFTYAEQRFVVLEHQEDGVFVLTEGKVGDSPFQSKDIDTPNDYTKSTLKEAVEDFVVRLITKGATLDDMVPFELDLRPTDMSTGYGTIMVQAAPLTLWQYGKFKDIIPLLDDWWWLATPLWTRWLRSPLAYNTVYAWYVYANGGCSYSNCSYSYGIRPALKLNSDLLVSVDGEENENEDCGECDNYDVDLSRVSNEALFRELERRLAEHESPEDDEEEDE